jgi:hypothetical protein
MHLDISVTLAGGQLSKVTLVTLFDTIQLNDYLAERSFIRYNCCNGSDVFQMLEAAFCCITNTQIRIPYSALRLIPRAFD